MAWLVMFMGMLALMKKQKFWIKQQIKYLAKQDLGMSAAQTLDVEKEALMDLSKGLVFKWERRQINRCCGYIRHISMQRERERESMNMAYGTMTCLI